jgi:hypothetical protein
MTTDTDTITIELTLTETGVVAFAILATRMAELVKAHTDDDEDALLVAQELERIGHKVADAIESQKGV